ncbi:hypothetical protein D3C85_662120 [compost metagenome]
MHQAAQAHVAMAQGRGRIPHQAFAAFADVGKVDLPGHWRPLQPKHQPGNVGGDPLQPCLAFSQGGQGPTPLGDIVEVNHQVFAVAKAQETQRHISRQNTAIGAHAVGFETLCPVFTGPGTLPEVQPTVHVQARFKVDQRPIDNAARCITKHVLGGTVGVTHMAVPIDPKDSDGTLID